MTDESIICCVPVVTQYESCVSGECNGTSPVD